jgi:putative FmdB family regulatory protein
MPLYSYRCDHCHTIWDVMHKMKESYDESCENCAGELNKYFGNVQIAPSVMPSRSNIDLAKTKANDAAKDVDMAAYKRLRKRVYSLLVLTVQRNWRPVQVLSGKLTLGILYLMRLVSKGRKLYRSI